jgi:hypothetical protein
MNAIAGDEASVGGVQHELVQLTVIAAHAQLAAIFFHGDDHALLNASAEVLDARARPDAGVWS